MPNTPTDDRGDASSASEPEAPPENLALQAPSSGFPPGETLAGTAYQAAVPNDVQATFQMHSGPLPPASDFAEYERVFPGAGRWLLEQAALDAAHVRDMDKSGLKLNKRQVTLRHVVPAIVVTVALVTSGAIAIFASPSAGVLVFGSTIASILTAYLTGRPWRQPEPAEAQAEDDTD